MTQVLAFVPPRLSQINVIARTVLYLGLFAGAVAGCGQQKGVPTANELKAVYFANKSAFAHIAAELQSRRPGKIRFADRDQVTEATAVLLDNERADFWRALKGSLPIKSMRAASRNDGQYDVVIVLYTQGFSFGGVAKGLARIPPPATRSDKDVKNLLTTGQPWQKFEHIELDWYVYEAER